PAKCTATPACPAHAIAPSPTGSMPWCCRSGRAASTTRSRSSPSTAGASRAPTGASSPSRSAISADLALSPEETRRYARHIVLKGLGGAGPAALKTAHVAVLGAGGLGAAVIAYLAAAGVGRLTIVDPDSVTLSNLQRQVIHRSDDEGIGKARSAARFVADLNPHVVVEAVAEAITPDNAPRLLAGATVVVE